MREILFRGKQVDNGEWVEGYLIRLIHDNFLHSVILKPDPCSVVSSNVALSFEDNEVNVVDPKSVGQFTGLTDKNGKKIFEGDNFSCENEEDYESFYLIEWDNDLSKFSVNEYGHAITYGEGSQEVYDHEISKVDSNVIDVADLSDDPIIGNIHNTPA